MKNWVRRVLIIAIASVGLIKLVAQEIEYGMEVGGAVSWLDPQEIKYDDNYRLGAWKINTVGNYFFYKNYYVSSGVGFTILKGQMFLENADSITVNETVFQKQYNTSITYNSPKLDIPVDVGFTNKQNPHKKDNYQFAGVGLINHFLISPEVIVSQDFNDQSVKQPTQFYYLSYSFFMGTKFRINRDMMLFLRLRYDKSILPLTTNKPYVFPKYVTLSVGVEFLDQLRR